MTSPATRHPAASTQHGLRWFFTDPSNGRIVVAQWPNWPLWLFIAATAVRLIVRTGTINTVASGVGTVAILIWAVWEIAQGSSPFRRVLGGLVVAWVVVSGLLTLLR